MGKPINARAHTAQEVVGVILDRANRATDRDWKRAYVRFANQYRKAPDHSPSLDGQLIKRALKLIKDESQHEAFQHDIACICDHFWENTDDHPLPEIPIEALGGSAAPVPAGVHTPVQVGASEEIAGVASHR